jgi:hypothetical protein
MALDRLSDCADVTQEVDALPNGTQLLHGQYRITALLNGGGFGIAYRAQDCLGRPVVLKECFVAGFSERRQGRVVPRSESLAAHQQRALASFLDEARILARLAHRNIVRVHQVFQENNTAYMALSFLDGQDLLEIVDEGKRTLSPALIVRMARKLVGALGHVHDRNYLHCDVSPDNICLTSDGEPVLIDFGAARRVQNGVVQPHSGFSMVKDGYSPAELYADTGDCGPWSDLYALGASLYLAVSGTVPADCQRRLTALAERRPDPLPPLEGRFPGYPPGFLASIDRAMAVRPAARYASAQDWLREIAEPAPLRDRPAILVRRVALGSGAGRAGVANPA